MKRLNVTPALSPSRRWYRPVCGALAALLMAGWVVSASAQQPAVEQGKQPSPEQIQKINQLQAELHQVNARIQAAQQKAHQKPDVREARVAYETTLNQAMIEQDPEIETVLEQREQLLSRIMEHPDLQKSPDQRSPAFMEEVQRYQSLEQRLQPVAREAAAVPAVAESRDKYQEKLISEMEKVDPETPRLLAARDNIVRQYEQVMQQAQP
jgi:hypothetical protein